MKTKWHVFYWFMVYIGPSSPVRTAHVCVHKLGRTVVHNTAENSSHNVHSYPPDNPTNTQAVPLSTRNTHATVLLALNCRTHVFSQFAKFIGVLAKNLFSRILEARHPVVVGEVCEIHLKKHTHTNTLTSIQVSYDKRVKKYVNFYSSPLYEPLKCSGMDHTGFTLQIHCTCFCLVALIRRRHHCLVVAAI